ncbi:PLDc N-terminal domain-containing protein [Patescibacteria group bacterium]|nr:PLDc N-terminal domain-containing protein [Patescibacteria group bacterium]
MKKIFIIFFIASLFFIGINVFAQSALSLTDKQQITNNLASLVQAINAGDIQKISALISPDNQTLQSDIQERIKGGIGYQLDYSPFDKNVEIMGQDQVKIKAKFVASGVGWNVSRLSTYFVFEKQNNQWFITDTDFYKKLGADYVFGILGKVFIFVGPILILLFAFWLWMLIDCVKREFDDKALWIILLIFLNSIAAILYFFIVKRKNITRKPLEFKM